MDFFERLFGIYPDGGTGLLEALYVFAIVNAITIGAVYRARRRGRRTVADGRFKSRIGTGTRSIVRASAIT